MRNCLAQGPTEASARAEISAGPKVCSSPLCSVLQHCPRSRADRAPSPALSGSCQPHLPLHRAVHLFFLLVNHPCPHSNLCSSPSPSSPETAWAAEVAPVIMWPRQGLGQTLLLPLPYPSAPWTAARTPAAGQSWREEGPGRQEGRSLHPFPQNTSWTERNNVTLGLLPEGESGGRGQTWAWPSCFQEAPALPACVICPLDAAFPHSSSDIQCFLHSFQNPHMIRPLWTLVLAPPICVTSGKSQNLSEPQFPPLLNSNKHNMAASQDKENECLKAASSWP